MLNRLAQSKGKSINIETEFDEDGSDLESPSESDDEDCGYLIPPEAIKKSKNMLLEEGEGTESKFYVGQSFENAKTFRKALIDCSISVGRDIPMNRNDS